MLATYCRARRICEYATNRIGGYTASEVEFGLLLKIVPHRAISARRSQGGIRGSSRLADSRRVEDG
jgi:hypothetical protein